MKSENFKEEIKKENTLDNDNRIDDIYQRKNNETSNNYKLIFIIIIIFPIIVYFFQINILYHLEYGDIEDFFKILGNTFKVAIPSLIFIGISTFIRKNSNESIFDNMNLLMISCFTISIFIGICLKDSSQLINDSIYEDKNSYSDSKYTDYNTYYSSTNDDKYCIAYGCAREKEPGYEYCDEHLKDPNWQPSYNSSSSTYTESYSNYHKCEYAGCTNYASGTKYCSKHNNKKCIKSGCNKIEAYPGAGYCKEHQLEQILSY